MHYGLIYIRKKTLSPISSHLGQTSWVSRGCIARHTPFSCKVHVTLRVILSGQHTPILPPQIAIGSTMIFPPRGACHAMK